MIQIDQSKVRHVTEDFVSSPGMEIRILPMDIYIENNNVNIYVDFAEMNKPPRK